jgi:hypothetical protein
VYRRFLRLVGSWTLARSREQLRTICKLIVASVPFSLAGSAPAQGTQEEYPLVKCERQGAAIREELKQRPHESWETVYHGGHPGLNQSVTRLFVSEIKGYVCMMPKTESVGTVRRNGDRLLLRSNYGDWGPGHATDTKDFVSVSWGKRLYLIESNRLIVFCNAVNAGQEPRREEQAGFLLREDDWQKDAPGAPLVPADFRRFLLKRPVQCAVRSVEQRMQEVPVPGFPYGDGKLKGTLATVSAGKSHGLIPQGERIKASQR